MDPKIRIRKAELQDMRAVFELSNDPVVRGNSIHKEPIPWETHTRWFTRSIACDSGVVFLIAETMSGEFVGQVRFNANGNAWVVSISVVSAFRGKGVAKWVLSKALSYVNGGLLKAEIASSNIASQKLFLSVGFVENANVERTDGFIAFTKGHEHVE